MKIIEIKLCYHPEVKIYEAWIKDDSTPFRDSDPIKAIQEALKDYNYNVHEEMYRILKSLSITSIEIENVIRRYEDEL